MTARGIRNCNPGNIRLGDPWKGLADEQTDPDFCVFTSAEYGFRAMAKLLLRYQSTYGCDTVQSMIRRWAPPSENDTGSYVASVSKAVGLPPSQPVRLLDAPTTFLRLLRAICVHENGECPYDDGVIQAGLAMAGVKEPSA